MHSIGRAIRPDWITRDVQLLIIARATMSAARSLLAVTVPIYLAKIGFSATRLGLLFTVTALASALMTASVGLLSDRIGRKLFVVGLPLVAALAALIFAFSRIDAVIFVCAALGSFGRGAGAGAGQVGPYAPAEQAIVADATPTLQRNAIFGRLAFASALGALVGNASGSLPNIAAHFGATGATSYRPAFLVAALLAAAAGAIALPIANFRAARRPNQRRWAPVTSETRPFLLKLLATNSINGLAAGFFGPFITYWFYKRYGVSSGTIGALYAVINLGTMGSVLSAAGFARRLGLIRTVVVSRLCTGLLLIPMALASAFWMAGAIYFVRMLLQRVGMPLRQSYVMAMVPNEDRGAVAGLSRLPAQATSTVSPTLAGYLFETVALSAPFIIGGALQIVNTALFYALFRHMPPPEEVERQAAAALPAATRPRERIQEHADGG